MQKIASGEIREFNLTDYMDICFYAKYKSKIESGFEFKYKEILKSNNRNIDVCFFTGAAGTGKTTLAKFFGKQGGIGYCVSSSSNDPLQDYCGEDTLILDDLRDTVFKFADLLKILDNHTQSTVKSRYRNKPFSGKHIIITSYEPINEWYIKVPTTAIRQFYRRISTLIEVSETEININFLDMDGNLHLIKTISNPAYFLNSGDKTEEEIETMYTTVFNEFIEAQQQIPELQASIKKSEDDSLPF